MPIDFLNNISLNSNEIQNVVVHKVGTDGSGVAGRIIYNSTDNVLKYHNGSDWLSLGNSSTITVASETGDATCFPLFANAATGDALAIKSNTGLTFNASTAELSSTIVSGTKLRGELDIGSISTGFGNIDNGSNTITTSILTVNTGIVPDTQGGANIGKNIAGFANMYLADGGNIYFGNDQDLKISHDNDFKLIFTNMATADDKPMVLQLKSEEDVIEGGEVIASLEFAAGDASEGDAALVAAGIHALAEGTFSSSANRTRLVFTTGASESADASAAAKMSLSSAGQLTIADDLVIKNDGTIGTTGTPGAITIADDGKVTLSGDLDVAGTTTTISSTTINVTDSLIALATNNSTSDAIDIGFYGLYDNTGSQDVYTGLTRDATDDKWHLWKLLQAAPTTTVNHSGAGFAVDTLVANLEGSVDGNVTGNVSGSALYVTQAAQGNITSLGTLTALRVDSLNLDGSTLSSLSSQDLYITPATGRSIILDGAINIDAGVVTGATSITSTAFAGDLTGDVTGDVSGSAGTLGAGGFASTADVVASTEAAKAISPLTLGAKTVTAIIVAASMTHDNIVTIKHDLNTEDILVELYDISTKATVYADVYRTTDDLATGSDNYVSIDFGLAPTNNIRCVITSVKGATEIGAGTSIAYT